MIEEKGFLWLFKMHFYGLLDMIPALDINKTITGRSIFDIKPVGFLSQFIFLIFKACVIFGLLRISAKVWKSSRSIP